MGLMNLGPGLKFHAAEFVNRKRFATLANSGLAEKNASWRDDPDPATSDQCQQEGDRKNQKDKSHVRSTLPGRKHERLAWFQIL
jgi:hypothetical protein